MTTHLSEPAKHHFLEFDCFEALEKTPEALHSLIKAYQEIFAEPEVWNETYDYLEVLQKIKLELRGRAGLRLCVDQNGDVLGFCWAQRLTACEVHNAIHSVHFIDTQPDFEIEQALHAIVGTEAVVYLQDLGVRREHRGSVSLVELIVPMLENVARRAGTRRLFFWSVSQTCVAWLAQKGGIGIALSIGDIQFFMGQIPELQCGNIASRVAGQ